MKSSVEPEIVLLPTCCLTPLFSNPIHASNSFIALMEIMGTNELYATDNLLCQVISTSSFLHILLEKKINIVINNELERI